jgi:hypothetical protein
MNIFYTIFWVAGSAYGAVCANDSGFRYEPYCCEVSNTGLGCRKRRFYLSHIECFFQFLISVSQLRLNHLLPSNSKQSARRMAALLHAVSLTIQAESTDVTR